ncbi:MAG: hypothetical protein B7X48_14060 [Acidiphilium sp. 34-60-192]|nr:MAG: hypothetical protein B7X48_14060 [Acidiphilium sp. 34-60-192]
MRQADPSPRKPRRQITLPGSGVVPGIAIGPIAFAAEPKLEITRQKIAAADIAAERRRLDEAVVRARQQLIKLRARLAHLPEESEGELGPLLDAHVHMLDKSRLMRAIYAAIEEKLVSATTAVLDVSEAQAASILQSPRAGTDDSGAAARQAEEVRELGRRLLRNLIHLPFRSFAGLPPGSLLVADALRPADAALIAPDHFAGIITEEGGDVGHTAVMLRPGPRLLADAAQSRTRFASAQRGLARLRRLASTTADHLPIELQANIELPFELPMVVRSGASGVGLMRTEFLFMNRDSLPDEATQLAIYRDTIEAMDGDPVTIRLLDWGSDKEVEALVAAGLVPETREENPALGLRGVRLLGNAPMVLETQLAAMLRAAVYGPVRILIPMVCRPREITLVRDAMDRVWRRLEAEHVRLPATKPPLGVMIETPAAVIAGATLARYADFFAIGTNDLTMYALAADRGLPARFGLYDALEPPVLRLIAMTVAAGDVAGIPVSLCGELASRPEAAPLLIGLGLRSLSMHGGAILRVKRVVRSVTLSRCEALAAAALGASEASTVHDLLDAYK